MLEFDYTNVLESAVGPHGIPQNTFDKAMKSTQLLIDALESGRTGGRLGFADLPFDEKPVKAVTTFARNHSFPNVLVLGIGGSALGPLALDAALGRPNAGKRLLVLDNIDPGFIRDTLDTIAPEDTIVNIIAKSGVTAETMATYAIVREWMTAALGPAKARDHFAVTTDPEKGDLLNIARLEKYPTFEIPLNVGGRFSVLMGRAGFEKYNSTIEASRRRERAIVR